MARERRCAGCNQSLGPGVKGKHQKGYCTFCRNRYLNPLYRGKSLYWRGLSITHWEPNPTPEAHVPIEPFALWLQNRVIELGVVNVTSAVRCSTKTLYKYTKQRVSTVSIYEVDRFMTPLGYNYQELYPDE